MFAGFLVSDDDDEFRDFAARHPFIELGHDLLDVGFDLIIRSDYLIVSIDQKVLILENSPSILRPYFLTAVKSSAG